MSQSYKSFQTYVTDSPIIKVGKHVNSNGDTVDITKDRLKEIYEQISGEVPIKDVHGGNTIGYVKKFILSDDGNEIRHKGFITDPSKFESRINNGFKNISPEIEVDEDLTTHSIIAKLEGIALTNNPGMIPDKVNVMIHEFEAPAGEGVESKPEPTSDGWKEPIGELGRKLDSVTKLIEDKFNTIGETKMPETPVTPTEPSNTITISKEDLADLIKSAVQEQLAGNVGTQPQEQPVVEEPPVENQQPNEAMTKLQDNYTKVASQYNRLLKQQYDEKLAEIRSLGYDHPEQLVDGADFTTEQKISVLESFKKKFVSTSSIGAPMDNSISGSSNQDHQENKRKVHYLDVLKHLHADSPEMRNKFKKLPFYDESGYLLDEYAVFNEKA